uniref:MAP3K12-binding inhibitory protein 1 n=1 Tax=Magallana gigas TaxID=29159 RepID=K1RX47_MAGGI
MVVPEEDGTKSKIKEQGGGHFAPLHAPSVKDKLLSNNIQIKASSQEIERRISAFIEQKRQEVDELNIREFCSTVTPSSDADSSCARVDSVFDTRIGGKSHIKVTRVVNLQGPQTQVSQSDPVPAIKKEPMEDPGFSGGMEERLQNIETHLKLDKRKSVAHSEQRTDLFSRVKKMEERILYLESLSPEYFRGGIPVAHSRKRKRIEDNISVRYQDLQNMDVADIDERIHMLRESLRRKAMNIVCLSCIPGLTEEVIHDLTALVVPVVVLVMEEVHAVLAPSFRVGLPGEPLLVVISGDGLTRGCPDPLALYKGVCPVDPTAIWQTFVSTHWSLNG